jgi:hypothetical protein
MVCFPGTAWTYGLVASTYFLILYQVGVALLLCVVSRLASHLGRVRGILPRFFFTGISLLLMLTWGHLLLFVDVIWTDLVVLTHIFH